MSFISNILRSSSYQVGTVFAALMLFGVFFVSYWLVIASDNALLRESEEAIRAEIRTFLTAEKLSGVEAVQALLEERVKEDSGYFYGLRELDGAIHYGNLPQWPTTVEPFTAGTVLFEIDHGALPDRDSSERIGSEHFDVMAKLHTLGDGRELLVGRDVDDLEIAQWVAEAFGWSMIAILLSICALSYGVAYYVASRFNRIAATTEKIIATGNLSERLVVDGNWDDLSKLTRLLNHMLEELEERVDGIESVTDNIAHDLRTPLMLLRANLESSTDGDVRAQLLEELDGILRIFNSLLRISSIEAGKQPITLVPVELSSLVNDVADLYEPLARERNIDVQRVLASNVVIGADRDLLFQALANLLDNALKFTPDNGVICFSTTLVDGQAVIEVQDGGPGIPEEERDKAFQRFGRLDTSRSRPGNGLGLPLALAVVRRHGGTLELGEGSGATPGLRVRATLPLTQ